MKGLKTTQVYVNEVNEMLSQMTTLRQNIVHSIKEIEKIDPSFDMTKRSEYETLKKNNLIENEEAYQAQVEDYFNQKQQIQKIAIATMQLNYLARKASATLKAIKKSDQQVVVLNNRLKHFQNSYKQNVPDWEGVYNLRSSIDKNMNIPDFINEVKFHEQRLVEQAKILTAYKPSFGVQNKENPTQEYYRLISDIKKSSEKLSSEMDTIYNADMTKLIYNIQHLHTTSEESRKKTFEEVQRIMQAKENLLKLRQHLLHNHYELGVALIAITGKTDPKMADNDKMLAFVDNLVVDINSTLQVLQTSKLEKTFENAKAKKDHRNLLEKMYDYTKHHPVKVLGGAVAGAVCFKFLPVVGIVKGAVMLKAAIAAKLGLGAASGAAVTAAGGKDSPKSHSYFGSFFHRAKPSQSDAEEERIQRALLK